MKTILITGSTAGIGKLAALRFAQEGHHILVHGRSQDKVDRLIGEIKSAANNTKIKGFVADFSDLEAVKNMATKVNNEADKLDVLINNAGVLVSRKDQSVNGFDIRFAVNYFAPVILTEALIPMLKRSEEPRIINLSSAAQSSVSLRALSNEIPLTTNEAYAQSKLALTMWSFDLAEKEKDLSVIAVNPGSLLNTKMANEAYGKHWSPAEKGSNILYDLAISDEYKNVSGKYFDNDKGVEKGFFSDAHSDAYNKTLIEKLISETAVLLA